MATLPPIYVINLKRNPERRLYMQRQLDAFGLEYDFVDVDDIDKYEMKSKTYRMRLAKSLGIEESLIENKYAAIIDHAKAPMNKRWENDHLGSFAATLSHIRIYDLMVKNDIDWACILEDDATLVPTFPEVLKIVPKLEWDILLLASQPTNISHSRYLAQRIPGKHFVFLRKFIEYLLSLIFRINNSNSSKQRTYQIKHLLEDYGIDPHLYPRQLEYIVKILEENYIKCENMMKKIMLHNLLSFLISYGWYKDKYYKSCQNIVIQTYIQFGALPEKSSLESINEYHRIAKPKYCPLSSTGYLVNQKAAMNWKRKALVPNILAIDQIPWELYENEQVKLRIVTLPCVHATYSYIKYSARRN